MPRGSVGLATPNTVTRIAHERPEANVLTLIAVTLGTTLLAVAGARAVAARAVAARGAGARGTAGDRR